MNSIIHHLMERKSVRAFTEQPITDDITQTILNAAMQAPTAGNQQLYTILHITSPERKQALADSCDHQPFIATAPLVLVFLADQSKWLQAYQAAGCEPRALGAGDLMLAVSDATIAAQNAVVAADSLGIGSCYIGDIMENCESLRTLLHLPKGVFPCCMLVMGYPTEQQKQRRKPERFALHSIVQENVYHAPSQDELRSMFCERAAREGKADFDYDRWMTAFFKRKYESDFSTEMSRSVREYWKDYES